MVLPFMTRVYNIRVFFLVSIYICIVSLVYRVDFYLALLCVEYVELLQLLWPSVKLFIPHKLMQTDSAGFGISWSFVLGLLNTTGFYPFAKVSY